MHDQDIQDSVFQLVMDQLEELVVTVFEELRERPGVVLAIAAGVLGAAIGSTLAIRASRSRSPAARAVKKARGLGEAADLLNIGMRLLQNPIVRGFAVAAIERQLKRRLSL